MRDGDTLRKIPEMNGWVGPRLGVRLKLDGIQLRLYHPDGRPFLSNVELTRQVDEQR
jgi:hypothetical protein